MSSTRTITIEPTSSVRASFSPESTRIPPTSILPGTSEMMNTAPASQQQVFQQESFSRIGNSRKLAILILIVGCNFVQVSVFASPCVDEESNSCQMISNILALSAGLEISKALGVKPGSGQANWVAASYP